MTALADHIFLTRFNLPSKGVESLIRAQEGWLRGRLALFERYTAPSVLSQSDSESRWLVYFDPESPAWLHEWIQPFAEQRIFSPVFRETVSTHDILRDATDRGMRQNRDLITTNLDNDDGLSVDFVRRLRSVTATPGRTAIYLTQGLILSPRGLFLRQDRLNAFCSVRESWDDSVTCWSDWHNLLPNSMPALEVRGEPGWLQVVHDRNVSNRVRGKLVSPERYRSAFGELLSQATRPTRTDIVRDRVIGRTRRAAQEGARSMGKSMIMRLGGKDGLDRVKDVLASRRRSHQRSLAS